ncbi:hypothetical protein T484DRAFT_1880536 [Baffinella frigidus]|nr:hypothetical protein T484DRAFT_1880536 [Cryptophyta sp. CCMP2293]
MQYGEGSSCAAGDVGLGLLVMAACGPSGLGVKRLAVSMKGREGMWPGEGSLSHVEGVGSGGMGAWARCGGSGAAAKRGSRDGMQPGARVGLGTRGTGCLSASAPNPESSCLSSSAPRAAPISTAAPWASTPPSPASTSSFAAQRPPITGSTSARSSRCSPVATPTSKGPSHIVRRP